jgi:hypothetical protein
MKKCFVTLFFIPLRYVISHVTVFYFSLRYRVTLHNFFVTFRVQIPDIRVFLDIFFINLFEAIYLFQNWIFIFGIIDIFIWKILFLCEPSFLQTKSTAGFY